MVAKRINQISRWAYNKDWQRFIQETSVQSLVQLALLIMEKMPFNHVLISLPMGPFGCHGNPSKKVNSQKKE